MFQSHQSPNRLHHARFVVRNTNSQPLVSYGIYLFYLKSALVQRTVKKLKLHRHDQSYNKGDLRSKTRAVGRNEIASAECTHPSNSRNTGSACRWLAAFSVRVVSPTVTFGPLLHPTNNLFNPTQHPIIPEPATYNETNTYWYCFIYWSWTCVHHSFYWYFYPCSLAVVHRHLQPLPSFLRKPS